MAIIDVLDAVEVKNDEDMQETTTPVEKPPLQQQYEAVKKETPSTSGMTKTGQTLGETTSYGQTRGESTGVSQTQQEYRTSKELPETSMEEWKNRFKYKDWGEFASDIGYTPPSRQELDKKQKQRQTVAWIKGLGGAANELAKMIGVSAGGDAAVGQYTIPEVEEAKKAEEDYLKKLEKYKERGLDYELGLRDKYAQYLQNMATSVSKGGSQTQTASQQEGESLSQQTTKGETYRDTASVNAENAFRYAQIKKLKDAGVTKPQIETHPFGKNKYFSVQAYDERDKSKVNRAYTFLSESKGKFTPNEMKILKGIVTSGKGDKTQEKEDYQAQYRYTIQATKMLLDRAEGLENLLNNPNLSNDEATKIGEQINDIYNTLNSLNSIGINLNISE